MDRDKYVAQFLYLQAIKCETEDRKNIKYKHDFRIIDEMISEINQLGYDLKYEADLKFREINDKRLIPIYEKFYLRFDNLGIAEDLLSLIDKRGFYKATPIVINLYEMVKKKTKLRQIASCDNALERIKDKTYIETYMTYLSNEEDVIRLPLTMRMLAKWKVPEAQPYFERYIKNAHRDIVFVAIDCLSRYKDKREEYKVLIEEKLNSDDVDIVMAAKKALKRLD